MPTCPQCENRYFSNKEALLQHMKTSSAWHPSCSICDRRFSSVQAYEAHMEAKHPPTYDCTVCNRPFHAPFALEDHYRGSPAHPNCSQCGRGFKDAPACEEHHRTAHPKVPCALCGGKTFYEEELDRHYFESQNHPSCTQCARGFKDGNALNEHTLLAHPEIHCDVCNLRFETTEALDMHYLSSPAHPTCLQCGCGFKSAEDFASHVQAQHPFFSSPGPIPPVASPFLPSRTPPLSPPRLVGPAPISVASSSFSAFSPELPKPRDTTLYSTGFTPLSPINPRFKDLIVGERRVDSPDLRLSMSFASPINEVQPPLFSPIGLPPPGRDTDRIWASHQNVQVPATSRIPLRSTGEPIIHPKSPPRRANTHFGDSAFRAQQVPPVIHSRSPPSSAPAAFRRALDSTTSLLDETFSPTGYISDTLSSFGDPAPPRSTTVMSPRLSRFTNEGRRISPPTEFHPRLYPGSVRAQAARSAFLRGGSQTYPAIGMPWRSRHQTSEPAVNSRSLIRNEDDDIDLNFDNTNLDLVSDVPTPRGETPVNRPLENLSTGTLERETGPTAAPPDPPVLAPITYNIIPSSECPSPRSPDVSSPVGLAVLPQISPLAATPVDLINFDIPEAHKPLPESPLAASPVTVVLDIGPGALTASPSSSSQSYRTSPQELEASRSPFDVAMRVEVATPPHLDTSPASRMRSFRTWSGETKTDGLNGHTPSTTRAGTMEPSSSIASRDQDSDVPPTIESSVTSLPTTTSANPLHCRACKAETCDDITATMCGHIFCNRCIVDAVIKTSRCPLCMTPTLLYCLFRLDLNT